MNTQDLVKQIMDELKKQAKRNNPVIGNYHKKILSDIIPKLNAIENRVNNTKDYSDANMATTYESLKSIISNIQSHSEEVLNNVKQKTLDDVTSENVAKDYYKFLDNQTKEANNILASYDKKIKEKLKNIKSSNNDNQDISKTQ